KEQSTFLEAPTRFEAGTLPVGEIYALGAAIDFAVTHEKEIHTLHRRSQARLLAAQVGGKRNVKVFHQVEPLFQCRGHV
ncbi:MAG: aminotransferase class V-fold PLP-dependent enzyme, partial [Hyphomicrobiaceae bacterium]